MTAMAPRDTAMVRAYEGGKLMREIGKDYSISTQRVSQLLNRSGVRGRLPGDLRKRRMLELYEQGLTREQIAAQIGCRPETVSNRLGRLGIRVDTDYQRERERNKHERDARIVRMYLEECKSQQEIADELGIRQPSVCSTLRRAGVRSEEGIWRRDVSNN